MKRYALLSVSDRTDIDVFARGLKELGYELLTSTGTGKFLAENGIESISIEEYTAQDEFLDGRVKTLHPKIHGGILARRNNPEDMKSLDEQGIYPIDIVAVNLYPFEEGIRQKSDPTLEEMVKLIDIGGPTMIRAAAKNCMDVYCVIDPKDYSGVLDFLAQDRGEEGLTFRKELATKVFSRMTQYNLEIAKFLSTDKEKSSFPQFSGVSLAEAQSLRYGENPLQQATLYRNTSITEKGWEQLSGKELSFNNILDADAGFRITQLLYRNRSRFSSGSIVNIVKHLSPCGAAVGSDSAEALRKAKACDPRSHFGGIIGFSETVNEDAANEIVKDFCEIVVAPDYSSAALEILNKKPKIRLLKVDLESGPRSELRSTLFGYLAQELDQSCCELKDLEVVTGGDLPESILHELEFAWTLVGPVKSNAVVFVKDQMLVAAGGGQTSRIDSVEVALYKAREHGHDLTGAVAASDAFFPFPDSIERLADAGIKAVATPGGSIKDPDVVQTAKERGIHLIFTPERHFRH